MKARLLFVLLFIGGVALGQQLVNPHILSGAIPTYVAEGTRFVNSTGGVVPHPAGVQAGDFLVIMCETTGGEAVTAPGGWNVLTPSPQENSSNISRLTLLYRYYVGGDSDPTIADPGDHLNAQMVAFRGTSPIVANVYSTSATSGYSATTNVSVPLGTTTRNQQLIAIFIADGADVATNRFAGIGAASSLDNLSHPVSQSTTFGDGGGLNLYYGAKTVAGSLGNLTATLGTGTGFVVITLALSW